VDGWTGGGVQRWDNDSRSSTDDHLGISVGKRPTEFTLVNWPHLRRSEDVADAERKSGRSGSKLGRAVSANAEQALVGHGDFQVDCCISYNTRCLLLQS